MGKAVQKLLQEVSSQNKRQTNHTGLAGTQDVENTEYQHCFRKEPRRRGGRGEGLHHFSCSPVQAFTLLKRAYTNVTFKLHKCNLKELTQM